MNIRAETERLVLRDILPADEEGLFLLDSDPEVHRYLGNTPVTDMAQVRNVISLIRQQYIDNGIGRWAVLEKKTGGFIGWAGLKLVKETTNGHTNFYDLGYRFIRKYWGQGFATEAALASLDYAFDILRAKEVYGMADTENEASDRVLRKAGLSFIETFYHADVLHNWYSISTQDRLNKA